MLVVRDDIVIPLEEFEFTYTHSSGPGGQNVNKVASRATLFWNPQTSPTFGSQTEAIARMHRLYPSYFSKDGVLIIASQRTRNAPQNRDDCLEKLRGMLQKALHKPKRRVPTKPTRASNLRRLNSKAIQSVKKANRRRVSGSDE